MTQAQYDPTQGAKVLDAWNAGKGTTLSGADAKNGLLALLVKAEHLAMAQGFATATTDDNGAVGAIVGGGIDRAKALAAQGDVAATVYLATHNAARRAQAEILTPSFINTDYDVTPLDFEPTVAPLVLVTIIVVAVAAAIAAAAWAYTTKVQVEAQTQQRIALANTALDAASSNNPNVRNNPDLWKTLQQMAGQEAGAPSGFPWGTILGIGALVVGGKFLLDYVRGDR